MVKRALFAYAPPCGPARPNKSLEARQSLSGALAAVTTPRPIPRAPSAVAKPRQERPGEAHPKLHVCRGARGRPIR